MAKLAELGVYSCIRSCSRYFSRTTLACTWPELTFEHQPIHIMLFWTDGNSLPYGAPCNALHSSHFCCSGQAMGISGRDPADRQKLICVVCRWSVPRYKTPTSGLAYPSDMHVARRITSRVHVSLYLSIVYEKSAMHACGPWGQADIVRKLRRTPYQKQRSATSQ
jgi:hypothetical protein